MRICFVSRGKLAEFLKISETIDADLVLCGFQALDSVNFEKELKGETRYFEQVAQLSHCMDAVVVCGCITDAKGFKRKSAVVAQKGRLLGVSDMLNAVDGEVSVGASLRVYETKIGRFGVSVAEDLYFPEIVKSLAICGSDFILCPYGCVESGVESVLIRAQAFCYGVPIFFCGIGYSAMAGVDGALVSASPTSPFVQEYQGVKEYHLVETRRRGFYRPPKKEF